MVPLIHPAAHAGSTESTMLAFSSVWHVLGPFQIGTREASWGADPLEYRGGFRNLEFDRGAIFKSSLSQNGTVVWSTLDATTAESADAGANASLTLSFPEVNWQYLQTVYGWSAFQYQAWARGEITVNAAQTVVLYTDRVLEFWLDGKHYFGGDFYANRKAPPVLHLEPGSHRLDLRLVRDVRAMGGVGDPTIPVDLVLKPCTRRLELADERILIPDIVDGRFSSKWGSVTVRNTGHDTIDILEVRPEDPSDWQGKAPTSNLSDEPIKIAPGQTRPLSFELSLKNRNISELRLEVLYSYPGSRMPYERVTGAQKVINRSIYDPHKVTFKHPGGIVSYAVLRPPARNATCGGQTSAPILLQLHGAGVEADSEEVSRSLDPLPDLCAWVLFPTGVTAWCGDDWHVWGFADVEAAISSLELWIEYHGWKGVGVDTDRWLVSGHSNGGQGAWYAMTHRPDKVIAAAPVSGYLSIERYVPYEFWYPMDPVRQSVLRSSLNNYRHELLAENCQGIPIFQQHGGQDDNVPTYHSRLMSLLLSQSGGNSTYSEIEGAGHWFDGIMTTQPLRDFYKANIANGKAASASLTRFTIVVANPGDMGSKGGITVTQLETPGQYGRMEVSIDALDEETCLYTVRTKNILSFSLRPHGCQAAEVIVNMQSVAFSGGASVMSGTAGLTKTESGLWEHDERATQGRRRGRQLGAMDALLSTEGIFTIRGHGAGAAEVALQISRNLLQYLSADAVIGGAPTTGNTITVAVGSELPASELPSFPIRVTASAALVVRDAKGEQLVFGVEDSVAAIFVRPGGGSTTELVVWGADAEGVGMAARLVPMLTGVGQPDFIVLAKSSRWKGVEGALAMGFFDSSWNITGASFL